MTETNLRAIRLTFAPTSVTAAALAGDVREMHTFTMKALATLDDPEARSKADLLWRADSVGGKPTLTIQTTHPEADFSGFGFVPGVVNVSSATDILSRLSDRLVAGSRLRFTLRANPTRSQAGKRVPITHEEDLIEWLQRAGGGAFSVAREEFFPGQDGPLAVSVEREGYVDVKPRPGQRGTPLRFSSVRFTGTLVVEDSEKMKQVLVRGLGRGRAFGFGLLQVA